MATVIYTRASRDSIRRMVRLLPAILSDNAPDTLGISHGFKMRCAMTFLSIIKDAFVVKSRGGTDEAGIKWAPLSKEYLAYGRRFGPGEQAALKRAAGLGPGNQKRGLLTAAQDKAWKAKYAQSLAWLAAREPIGAAKAKAAAIAWNFVKAQGAKTKLEVYGSRQVEMLRDTGVLFNSLSPGTMNESGATADYTPAENQYVREGPGWMIVGTNVLYAARQHSKRPLWPTNGNLPAVWEFDIESQAGRGLMKAIEILGSAA